MGYIKVNVGGVIIYTSNPDMAQCLSELDSIIEAETAEGADIDCVFKALNYLKKYRVNEPEVREMIKKAEEILYRDISSGKVKPW